MAHMNKNDNRWMKKRVEENSRFKILIVDDIVQNIQILGNILMKESYRISYTQKGDEALRMIRENNYDLILLDIMMPDVDGFEVCRQIKTDKEFKDIPVIFLTAKVDKESIIKGFNLGAEDYVTKPFSAEELLARVKTHLALKDQREKLRDLNTNLEKKVQERTEQLWEANRQLTTLEKAKSDFLSIISHELRTPLNGIIALTELIKDTLKSSENEEYVEYLREASDHLMKFSEVAILITSLKADQYKINYSPQKLKYIIEHIREVFSKTLAEKNLQLEFFTCDEEIQINVDFDLIIQCLQGIVDNAIRYSPEGETITILCARENSKTLIRIDDKGPGFSKEDKNRLFHYFHSNDVTHSEGLGLSLAAAKLIMDAHNGYITVDDNKYGGASISLTFPDS